jgi:hypothetical protein
MITPAGGAGVYFWHARIRLRHAKIWVMGPARSFSPAVEDYLKAIYRLQTETAKPVTTNALGGWLGVTAGSASGMLRKLDDLRLIVYVPYHGVRLSEAGWRAALGVVRRHRLTPRSANSARSCSLSMTSPSVGGTGRRNRYSVAVPRTRAAQ